VRSFVHLFKVAIHKRYQLPVELSRGILHPATPQKLQVLQPVQCRLDLSRHVAGSGVRLDLFMAHTTLLLNSRGRFRAAIFPQRGSWLCRTTRSFHYRRRCNRRSGPPSILLIELIKNSLDAQARAVHVEVDYLRGGCCVEDDGTGIPAEELSEHGRLGSMYCKWP
jgi:hypothetical protein